MRKVQSPKSKVQSPDGAPTLDMRSGRSGENSFATSGGLIPEIVSRKSSAGNREEVMTLAIRGRGDECNLEIRQDGTANAILTPNGGRGGIGCGAIAQTIPIHDCTTRHAGSDGTGGEAGKGHGMGIAGPEDPMFTLTKGDKHSVAIAFDEAQITSKANRTKSEPGLPASTISKDSRMMVAHTLKSEGFDASEDGSGRGVPLIAEVRSPECRVHSEEGLPQVVGALSDGAHMGGGRTDRTLTPAESLPCVSSKWSKGSGGPAGDECQNLVLANRIADRQGGFFNDAKETARDPADGVHGRPTVEQPIAFPARMSATQHAKSEGVSCAISSANPTAVSHLENGDRQDACPTMAVRRLTPRECERLQGFPDDFTLVKIRGKAAADGPRYKAIGNSMAVPNIEWIGRRMDLVDELVPYKGMENQK